MRSSRLSDEGGRLADLDRARSPALSVPLCHHEQEGYRMAAIHPRHLGMENRCRSRFRQLQIGGSCRRQDVAAGASSRAQRYTGSFHTKGRKVMMLKRISVGLLAIIIYGLCLEIGERF